MPVFMYFQNPASGFPMLLKENSEGLLCVTLDPSASDDGMEPTDEDRADARTYSQAVRGESSLYSAARLLRSMYGADVS